MILARKNLIIVTISILLALFMASVETTVIGTAMPTIISDLGGLDKYSWVFAVYMLSSTTMTPIFGKLSDLYGRRPIFLIGLIIFLAGSILSGLSQNMTQLIIFRLFQGIGAGGILPLAFIVIGDIYTLQQRARIQGLFSSVWGVSSIVGPLLGGFLVDNISWHWVFYINVPIGLVVMLLIFFFLAEPLQSRKKVYIDFLGVFLLITGVSSLLILLLREGDSTTLISGSAIILATVSLLSLVGFLVVERRAAEPLIPLNLFNNRLYSVAAIGGFLAGLGLFGLASFIPLFMQTVVGTTATEAGAALTPQILGWTLASAVGGQLFMRFGTRRLALSGAVFMIAGAILLATTGEGPSRWQIMAAMAFLGAGMGLTISTYTIAVQNSVARERLGAATSTLQFTRTMGGTLGVSIMGSILAARLSQRLTEMPNLASQVSIRSLLNATELARLPAETILALRGVFHYALSGAFSFMLIAVILAVIAIFFTPQVRHNTLRTSRLDEPVVVGE
ncbi:MAG: MFS transporter [Chloroflexi bacterium]|nr:MFS transporter [Chloroflexota bacterium]